MSIKEYWKAYVRSVRSFTTIAIYGHLSGANLNSYNAHCSSDPFKDCSCILPDVLGWSSSVVLPMSPFRATPCWCKLFIISNSAQQLKKFQQKLRALSFAIVMLEKYTMSYATIQPDFIEQLTFRSYFCIKSKAPVEFPGVPIKNF